MKKINVAYMWQWNEEMKDILAIKKESMQHLKSDLHCYQRVIRPNTYVQKD